jgi:hypothetical protein
LKVRWPDDRAQGARAQQNAALGVGPGECRPLLERGFGDINPEKLYELDSEMCAYFCILDYSALPLRGYCIVL